MKIDSIFIAIVSLWLFGTAVIGSTLRPPKISHPGCLRGKEIHRESSWNGRNRRRIRNNRSANNHNHRHRHYPSSRDEVFQMDDNRTPSSSRSPRHYSSSSSSSVSSGSSSSEESTSYSSSEDYDQIPFAYADDRVGRQIRNFYLRRKDQAERRRRKRAYQRRLKERERERRRLGLPPSNIPRTTG
jgi:hypothetical protein